MGSIEAEENAEPQPVDLEKIPESIETILSEIRKEIEDPDAPNQAMNELGKLLVEAEEKDRDDLVTKVNAGIKKLETIKAVWRRLHKRNKVRNSYIDYEELNTIDPDLQKDDFKAMSTYHFPKNPQTHLNRITAKDAIDYLRIRKSYESMISVAKIISANLGKPVREIKKRLRYIKRSSTLREYIINLGSSGGRGPHFYLVDVSMIAQIEGFIQKKFEAEERESAPSKAAVPCDYVHIEDACESTGITYSELIKAAKKGKILHAVESRGKSIVIHFDPVSLEDYVLMKKQESDARRKTSATRLKESKKTKTKKDPDPADDETIIYNNFHSPVEINAGPIPIERILDNGHYVTRSQLMKFYSLTQKQADQILNTDRLKKAVFVGKERYLVANWLIESIKSELGL
ncbi:hypothetical protein GF371_03610 [Candidatus Woesearchaeota archaeon]|nr:hypothetical protein [Candidatus Woesearchaeota archaeon]